MRCLLALFQGWTEPEAVIFAKLVLLYALYLEYNAQEELERRQKELARSRQRWDARI